MVIWVSKFTNLGSPKLDSISRISRPKCLSLFRGVEGIVFEPDIANIGREETNFCQWLIFNENGQICGRE